VLLSVSKDRHIGLFHIAVEGSGPRRSVRLVGHSRVRAHGRIIWSCNWSPDDKYFATGSRDKYVKIWKYSMSGSTPVASEASCLPAFASAVTAVAWAPLETSGNSCRVRVLAVGLEDGRIQVWAARQSADSDDALLDWCEIVQIDSQLTHGAAVKRLSWRPSASASASASASLSLASCAADSTVRLFSLLLPSGEALVNWHQQCWAAAKLVK
jgi:elongator complex protein 2